MYLVLEERGLSVREDGDVRRWVGDVTGGKVEWEDFGEVAGLLREGVGVISKGGYGERRGEDDGGGGN